MCITSMVFTKIVSVLFNKPSVRVFNQKDFNFTGNPLRKLGKNIVKMYKKHLSTVMHFI
jgi:hypothetical protein